MAQILAAGLSTLPGVKLCHPVEANELFVALPEPVITGLLAAGFQFYRWDGAEGSVVRLVTAFNTVEADIQAFVTCAQRHAQPAGSRILADV